MQDTLYVELGILTILLIVTRFFYVIHKITTGHTHKSTKRRSTPAKTLICIGSGGHTTEMMILLDSLDLTKYSPRYYITAKSDTTSLSKVTEFETRRKTRPGLDYFIQQIPRSRIVNQSYWTSVFTTLYSIFRAVPSVVKIRPDLILCNGPGTCVPICLIALVLKVAFVCDSRIVFVESFCRTKSFSLSGRILTYVADNIVVQWPGLEKKLKRADYIGQLM